MDKKNKLLKLYSLKEDINLLKQIVLDQIDQQTEYRFDVPVVGKSKVKTKF